MARVRSRTPHPGSGSRTSRPKRATGDAIIALTSGGGLLATRLAPEWTYRQTGRPDVLAIGTALGEAVAPLLAGWAAVIVAALFCVRARRRAAARVG